MAKNTFYQPDYQEEVKNAIRKSRIVKVPIITTEMIKTIGQFGLENSNSSIIVFMKLDTSL